MKSAFEAFLCLFLAAWLVVANEWNEQAWKPAGTSSAGATHVLFIFFILSGLLCQVILLYINFIKSVHPHFKC